MIALMNAYEIPTTFLLRRLHSITGLGLVLFLFFHLFTNSEAALWFGDDGKSFIKSVNSIHETPYLQVVEILLLGAPILIHALFGLHYLKSAAINDIPTDGSRPYLAYGRNHAYTWQRITSWILLFGILLHVFHMRFYEAPQKIEVDGKVRYEITVTKDPGLASVAKRVSADLISTPDKIKIVTNDFGTAELMMLRDQFKSPLIMALYTIFVFAACFHAFNGLWSFMISWGVTLTVKSQEWMLRVATFLMGLTLFFGLITIYTTYWINLKS